MPANVKRKPPPQTVPRTAQPVGTLRIVVTDITALYKGVCK